MCENRTSVASAQGKKKTEPDGDGRQQTIFEFHVCVPTVG